MKDTRREESLGPVRSLQTGAPEIARVGCLTLFFSVTSDMVLQRPLASARQPGGLCRQGACIPLQRMAFYDHIAKRWHAVAGFDGGPFRRFVLNALLINAVRDINDRAIIELGAGNGYFLPLLMRRYSAQQPARVVITDQSKRQLGLAKKHFAIEGVEYTELDVRNQFPFRTASFDLVIATMVFNELSKQGVASAIAECRRVLRSNGQLLATVIHPDFVARLSRRGELRRERRGLVDDAKQFRTATASAEDCDEILRTMLERLGL